MSVHELLQREADEHRRVLDATVGAVAGPLEALVDACIESLRSGGKLLLFGNGGSAADAQHIATELTVRYRRDRAPLAALALTTDSSALTAGGNDLGFEEVFSRQLAALGRPGDVAIGLSTSGRSPNVVRALETARAHGMRPAALTAGDGALLAELADPLVAVPEGSTARIQEMHALLGHVLCAAIEDALFPAPQTFE